MTATKRTVMCALTWKEISYQNEARTKASCVFPGRGTDPSGSNPDTKTDKTGIFSPERNPIDNLRPAACR